MLIIEMIIRITGWSQEELANVLGVSRVSVNCWLNGNDISLSSRKLISDKFNFPINFFDISLDENIENYKLIYSVLYKNLKKYNSKEELTDKDKIQDILNRVEFDDKSINDKDIEDDDIIDGLLKGYDPFTGEVLSSNHLINNPRVKHILTRLRVKHKFSADNMEYDDLNYKQKRLYDKLKEWRLDTMHKQGITTAYVIIPDKTIMNIVCSEIKTKEDLLKVKGIRTVKYERYGDDIYNIIKGCD